MKVFISSVRRDLEAERDSLPGLIRAIGHDPKRFEDFGAQALPSREACLRGVEDSDVYLLLLGPKYGHVFPETGQSATHDEWVAAVTKGMHRLVFRKVGVEYEPEQEEFARLVGDYGHGVFYAEFTDVVDLQAKVVQALRSVEAQPSALKFSPLLSPVEVGWREDSANQGWTTTSEPWLELHAVAVSPTRLSTRQLRELSAQLISSLRRVGAVALTAGVQPSRERDAVVVELPRPDPTRWDQPRESALCGVRVQASGQVSLWWSLPGDGLGRILDAEVLSAAVARGLRLIGALQLLPESDCAIAIGLGGSLTSVSEGKVTGVARNRASGYTLRSTAVRVPPDEAVSTAAFDRGADEVARSLVQSLFDEFRSRR
jgi:hypothetical protein